MRSLVLTFILSSLCMLTLSRCLLAGWQWHRVRQAGGLKPILLGGLRIDANQIAMIAGIPAVLSFWLAGSPLAIMLVGIWFQFAWLLLVLLEVSTPQFIHEYDSRPNRLYVEYLKHPREVFGMLWKGYKGVLLGAAIVLALAAWAGHRLFGGALPEAALPWWLAGILSVVTAAVIFLAIRGTLGHRPMNPSSVAYCGDSMLNTLPLNSLYSVAYAIYSMKNERSAADVYGKLDDHEVTTIVNASAGITGGTPDIPSLHGQQATCVRTRPLNLVMIVQESLGAQYVSNLGGMQLTPI